METEGRSFALQKRRSRLSNAGTMRICLVRGLVKKIESDKFYKKKWFHWVWQAYFQTGWWTNKQTWWEKTGDRRWNKSWASTRVLRRGDSIHRLFVTYLVCRIASSITWSSILSPDDFHLLFLDYFGQMFRSEE